MNPSIEPIIICPQCHTEIKLTESLAAPLIQSTRLEYEQKFAKLGRDMSQREQFVKQQETKLAALKANLEQQITEQVAAKLQHDRAKLSAEAEKKARLAFSNELTEKAKAVMELEELLKQRDEKLSLAQQAQAALIKKQRELDDAHRELELTVQKRVQEGLQTIREQAKREAEDVLKLKVMEKDQTINAMQQKIEELKQKAEQGSQQLQGEVQELELENVLRNKFPFDSIEPVPKGEFGGDVIQRVMSAGLSCGTLLWESKRTRNWSDQWLSKLREDQRRAKADLAVIVTQVLPKNVETFDIVDNIWVVQSRAALPVATILRLSLIELAQARLAGEGQQTKTELLYQYLTGPRFRQRVEAIVEAFTTMSEDLDKERRVIIKQWAKREEQIQRVMNSTVGMYGDLQGIAGKSLLEIEGLSFNALDVRSET